MAMEIKKISSAALSNLLRAAFVMPLLASSQTTQTIQVQPLNSGEYILTLEQPILFTSDFDNSLSTSMVIDGVFDLSGNQGTTTARSLGEGTTDLALSFGQSPEATGQTGIIDQGDLILSADTHFPFFHESASQSQITRSRILIQPLAGLEHLTGERTVFLTQENNATDTVTVTFVMNPVLTPTPIISPTISQHPPVSRVDTDDLLLLNLTGNNQDLQLQVSSDMITWSYLDLFPPEGITIDLPMPTGPSSSYWRLVPSYLQGNFGPPETDLLSVSGLLFNMGPEGQYTYNFKDDGTGQIHDTTSTTGSFPITWTESSHNGYTHVIISLPSRGQQHHFLRAYQSVGGEVPATHYQNYVSTFGANEANEVPNGAGPWDTSLSAVIITPTGPLIGKKLTLQSSDPSRASSDYTFISPTEIEINTDPEVSPPLILTYQILSNNDEGVEMLLTHPSGIIANLEIIYQPDEARFGDYIFSAEDSFLSDSGTITE